MITKHVLYEETVRKLRNYLQAYRAGESYAKGVRQQVLDRVREMRIDVDTYSHGIAGMEQLYLDLTVYTPQIHR